MGNYKHEYFKPRDDRNKVNSNKELNKLFDEINRQIFDINKLV